MKGSKFYIVDVFGQSRFTGNQLAVFTNGEDFSDEEMQALTDEINFSETTFVLPKESKDNTFKVRIFVPGSEIPFAGHPTLGTAYVIQKYMLENKQEKLILDLKAGLIPVTIDYRDNEIDLLTMKQNQPEFGETFDTEKIKKVINTDEIDSDFPIEAVSTGIKFILIPLNSLQAIQNVNIDVDKLKQLLEEDDYMGIFLFTRETYKSENDINCRMFCYFKGLIEDPVTGSANGCMLAYMLKNNYFNSSSINIKVEQGWEISRNGMLYLRGEKRENEYDLFVGGRVFPVSEGKLL
ncbi:PhzF family phenazine biosynthesis protein [candidate division KSB1 bacterium]